MTLAFTLALALAIALTLAFAFAIAFAASSAIAGNTGNAATPAYAPPSISAVNALCITRKSAALRSAKSDGRRPNAQSTRKRVCTVEAAVPTIAAETHSAETPMSAIKVDGDDDKEAESSSSKSKSSEAAAATGGGDADDGGGAKRG